MVPSVNVWEEPKTAVDGASHFTALHAAAWAGNASAAAVLLKHGANPAAREERYCGTPAGWANYAGFAETRDLILNGPIDIFDALDFDLTHRIPGVLERDPGALNRPFGEYVVGQPRANHWWPDPGCTPLMWAVKKNKVDAARALLEHGADAAVRDPEERSLVDVATREGHEEIAQLLQKHLL
jgi:ankyrin repeat protein